MLHTPQLEAAIWSIADGRSSEDDVALFHADERASLVVLDRLIIDAEDDVASVRNLPGDVRDQVVADLTDTLDSLRATAARLRPPVTPQATEPEEDLEPGEVELQASWSAGHVVVWAAGRGAIPESNAGLAARLEAIGGPPMGGSPSETTPGAMSGTRWRSVKERSAAGRGRCRPRPVASARECSGSGMRARRSWMATSGRSWRVSAFPTCRAVIDASSDEAGTDDSRDLSAARCREVTAMTEGTPEREPRRWSPPGLRRRRRKRRTHGVARTAERNRRSTWAMR